METFRNILITVIVAVSATILYLKFFSEPNPIVIKREGFPALTKVENYKEKIATVLPDFKLAALQATPAVINIQTFQKVDVSWWKSSDFEIASGSGVLISPDGYIVTNSHVVDEGNDFLITLYNKRDYKAKLIGMDYSTDIALMKIDDDNLPFMEFGDSDSLFIGEWVLAVGNPFNLSSTVTAGIVSAKGRNIDILEGEYSIESFIQTDAAVNPGNSGGALVNVSGDLVGINTAIITRTGKYEGYSFAIPSNLVKKIVADLKTFGSVQRGLLGVEISNVTNIIAKEFNLPHIKGIVITGIIPQSGAAEAGLKKNDIIIKINNVSVNTIPELQEQVAKYRPGETIKVAFLRKGKHHSLLVQLKDKTNSTNLSLTRNYEIFNHYGLEIRELKADEIEKFSTKGIFVSRVKKNSIMANTHLEKGFIIVKANNEEIQKASDFLKVIEKAEDKILLEGFYGNYEGKYFYTFSK